MKNGKLVLKLSIKQFKEELCKTFCEKKSISKLTEKLVQFIDKVLKQLFEQNELNLQSKFCLLALGSYGRRELQLYSDIDLLLLHQENLSKRELLKAQAFIQDCWDAGLAISHQITTVKACAELAASDLSVISSIIDMRLICGSGKLMEELAYQTHPLHLWPSDEYFLAKKKEQEQRYKKYGETEYNLEPNIKNGCGGLRDLQILLSIGKRHFGINKFSEIINSGFMTEKEYEELISCLHYLWRLRFALHCIAGKQEERLVFDYQIKLATLFGFVDKPESLAIEQFMKAYFNLIKRSRELNEMLLQCFAELIFPHRNHYIEPLDQFFELSNNYIQVRSVSVFVQRPQALFELFLWIAKRPKIKGIAANTARLIREHLYLIGNRFKQSSFVTAIFLAIFKTEDPYPALDHMNRHGLLSHYLDGFAALSGQMQYDLFHAFTVDQHSLFVIRNLARFLDVEYAEQFPLASKLMPQIKNRFILYLAALFHDIGKGRGGNHSQLGAEEAQQFALWHQLNPDESQLLVWLVQHHLLMSHTAQRQDIYDLKTVNYFCSLLPRADYLEYLYLLTVADICATNDKLWNAWKDSLLKELYAASKQLMKQKLDESTLINNRKQKALEILLHESLSQKRIEKLWATFKDKYFLHEPAEVIARHTQAILACEHYPLVQIMPHHSQGGTEVFIYMPHQDARFTIATTVLSNHAATIQEATILTFDNHFDLDTYIILDEHHQAFFNKQLIAEMQAALEQQLADNTSLPVIKKRRITRTQAHFKLKPQIEFNEEKDNQSMSSFFLVCPDRPGLLAVISRILSKLRIHLHYAKIVTAGERAEDVFFISTSTGKALNNQEKEKLRDALILELIRLCK